VGKIEDAQLFKKEERKLEEQGCSAHIKFVGELKIDRLAEYYERAWIMVHPSHTEAFPRVLVEAMNFGLPCIATRVGGVSEIIEDRVNGFTVEVGDVVQMARCAVELLENSQLRHELSKNALATYTERFSNKVMAEKVMNVIESNW
jgi:glycosyltransferase involved in cell wall biosynthesis